MKVRLSIVLDCADPERLAGFWAAALGYVDAGWPHEPYVVLVPPDGRPPFLLLQRVAEPKAGKNRMHMDLHPEHGDIAREAERLVGLGATRVTDPMGEHGATWIVMNDPEGNEFCVCHFGGQT